MSDIRGRLVQYVTRFVEQRILADGGEQAARRITDRMDGSGFVDLITASALPAAIVSEAACGAALHPQADRIRRIALRLADLKARLILRHSRPGHMPFSFGSVGFGPTVELLTPHASASRRRLWGRAMAAYSLATRQFLLSKKAAWGRPGPYTGCGPNHLFLMGAALYRFGRLTGNATDVGIGRTVVRRMCGIQAANGCFVEDTGPVVAYHGVSLFGLMDYHSASGDRAVAGAFERGVDFLTRTRYPDLGPLTIIDQRNRVRHSTRWQSGRRRWGGLGPYLLTFGHTPEGRRLAHAALDEVEQRLDAAQPRPMDFYALGMAAMGAWTASPGPTARRLAIERPACVNRIDALSATVRRDGWCVGLCAHHVSQRPGNPFILDRTQNLSLYHDRHGLLIGGGNDKQAFDAATLEICESGYVYYFPALTGRVSAAGRGGSVELYYGSARAKLSAKILSPRQVELIAGAVTNYGHQANRFNLQIPYGVGTPVRIDGSKVMKLTGRAEEKDWTVRRSFEIVGRFRVEALGGATFCWPHFPWHSYNEPTYRSGIDEAVGYLRLAMSGRDLTERTVRVTAL
ncbi:MAG: hypothetical protein BIFFINMI_03625 [Phycisphaerae bacterium]|nr:hypothetical protein [Phycisphaerae bacterium]